MNKKGIEFSFGWIFAILVGVAILFLGLFAAGRLMYQERQITDSFTAKQLNILLSPLETGIESGKFTIVDLGSESRISFGCLSGGPSLTQKTFGLQSIGVATRSSIGKEWGESGIENKQYNKHIFSPASIETKSFAVFSKPFYFPYKIADVLYIIPLNEQYCFVNPPRDIELELEDYRRQQKTFARLITVNSSLKECGRQSTSICFGSTGCDIVVDVSSQSVKKFKHTLYYEDDPQNVLLYGALFSDPGIYECEVKRLFLRAGALAELYRSKNERLSPQGCESGMESDLTLYHNLTRAVNHSLDLRVVALASEDLRRKNAQLICPLF